MNAITLSPITTRFAWKEFRTLCSFWLAAFVIAALLQAFAIAFVPRSADPVATMFGIALAAAALYAVGVAATTFSMEHEEETYAYLTGLPTRWLPLFAGKCSFAAVSSFLLAAALLTTAWLFAGGRTPNAGMTAQLFAGFGFGIVEMLAWGVFFSLLIRQPLLAALLAIGTESLVVTWTASVFATRSNAILTLASYADVLLPRIAIAAVVLAVDVLLARRWLVHEHQRHAAETIVPAASAGILSAFAQILRAASATLVTLARHYSPRVFSHLAWQAWRQSWKPMLAMTLIVPALCVVLVLIAGIWNLSDRIRTGNLVMFPYLIALVAMAIYWSVVFYADQRQSKYRFLAEHAVWPRYVWLSRLMVWSLPILLLAVTGTIAAIVTTFNSVDFFRRELEQTLRHGWWQDGRYLAQQWRGMDLVGRSITFGMWGAIVGAALGQATSLFFRRALVAGFAAMVIAIPLAAWGFAAWSWELNPRIFLAPLAFGLVAVTWLRMPDWLVDRNSLASWAKVAAALIAPLGFIAWQLPAARTITQVEQYEALACLDGPIRLPHRSEFATALPIHADQIVSHWVQQSAAELPHDNQATVDRLVRFGELIESPRRPVDAELLMGIEGGLSMEGEGGGLGFGMPPNEYVEQMVKTNRAILKQAVELAQTNYRFTVSDGGFGRIQGLHHWLNEAGRLATRDGKLDAALDYHLAALTLWERLWTGQSTRTYQSVQNRLQAQSGLVEWAGAEGQTSERIKRAIAALDKIYPPATERQSSPESVDAISDWTPPPQILATYQRLHDILLGKQPSSILGKHANVDAYVAVMSNELPLERARALTILDFVTISQVARWRDVVWRINQQLLQEWSQDKFLESGEQAKENISLELGNKIRLANSNYYFNRYPADWKPDEPPDSWLRTSPFLRMELFKTRNFSEWLASVANTEVAAWGLRQQLALLAYRADHGKYPATLADLVPDYLPFVPIDPYSGREFEYYPQGLKLELRFYADRSESIPPHTPLLWSVGAEDQRLDATFVTESTDPTAIVNERHIRRDVYQLSGYSWSSESLVFRLPTIPKSLADEESSPSEEP